MSLSTKIESLLSHHRGTHKKVASDEDMHLPLHAPKVQPLYLDKLMNTGNLAVAASWVDGLDKRTSLRKRQKSNARQEDLKTLLDADIIEKCTKQEIRVTGNIFSVVEEHKKRRRPIFWPKSLNAAVADQKPDVQLRDAIQHAQIARDVWAATFDLKASFFQVELPAQTREFFGLHTEFGCFRYKRLPMGFSASPYVMHAITSLAASAGSQAGVRTDVYIDNVRFTSKSRDKVVDASDKFVAFCKEHGITLNKEEGNAPHRQGEFLGLEYDYENGVVRLGAKSINKLRTTTIAQTATRREYLQLFGLMLFATRALRVHPAKFFSQIKFIRKRCCTGDLDETVAMWPSAAKGFDIWLKILSRNTPTRHEIGEPSTPDALLFTDASVTGWGAVLVRGSGVFSVAGRWAKPITCAEICEYEARAIALAVERFSDALGDAKTITIRTDNSAALFTLKKGVAREFELNRAIAECAESFRRFCPNAAVYVNHVATAENPADPLSRGRPYEQQVLSTLRARGVVGSGELKRVFTQSG